MAWQSSVAVVLGLVVGVPLGIVAGRFLWDLFATNIYVVSSPTVPALAIVAIGLGALVLGNLVAAIPGRIAARTPAALLLRTEDVYKRQVNRCTARQACIFAINEVKKASGSRHPCAWGCFVSEGRMTP